MFNNNSLINFSFIISILIHTATYGFSENVCFNNDIEKIHQHLGTKTPYRFIQNENNSIINVNDCQPTRIWGFIRHGTRRSSKQITHEIHRLIEIRNEILRRSDDGTLCLSDIEQLRKWSIDKDYQTNEGSNLVDEGFDEMVDLGERMQHRFPNLLLDLCDNEIYKFKFTDTQRTRKSFEGFATGLFGRHSVHKVEYNPPQKRDPILRFYKLCSKWVKGVDKNASASVEKSNWLNSKQMDNILHQLRRKTGVPNLDKRDLYLIYTVCSFETAWNKFHLSPWCLLFDSSSIRVLEYMEDLKYYWIDGYGHDITYRQACPLMGDLMKHIDPTSVEPRATFYFTHSGAILKLLAHLGLYKDDFHLTANDFDRERKWKVSQIDAFGSNIFFILFECKSDEPSIMVMHQEKIVRLPGCPTDNNLCPLDVFKEIYKNSINSDKCQFENICQL